MVTVHDVVRSVAGRGAASLEDLEGELAGDNLEALVQALDACVDHGYLRLALRRGLGPELPYRVTARGRRLLTAASRSVAAA